MYIIRFIIIFDRNIKFLYNYFSNFINIIFFNYVYIFWWRLIIFQRLECFNKNTFKIMIIGLYANWMKFKKWSYHCFVYYMSQHHNPQWILLNMLCYENTWFLYLSMNDLHWILVEFGSKFCKILCDNNTNILSWFSLVSRVWNDFIEWFNNVICIVHWMYLCCAFKNTLFKFLMSRTKQVYNLKNITWKNK